MKTPKSIFLTYPFTEEWEINLCKKALSKACKWAEEIDKEAIEIFLKQIKQK